jgi:RecB family exonuclease
MIKRKVLKVIPENRKDYFNCSVSKMKTFKSCKQKYYFTYVLKLPRKSWPFQVFGKFLHKILENFQNEILSGSLKSDEDIMKSSYDSAFEEYKKDLDQEQITESKDICTKYLAFRKNLKDKNILPKIIKAEKEFLILIDDKILLNGFIDLLENDHDGIMLVSDYKTSKDDKYLKKDFFQLKTYAYAMFLEDDTLNEVKTAYIMLKHKMKILQDKFERDSTIKYIEEEFLKFFEEVSAEKLFRPTKTPLCKFCDYVDMCPAHKSIKTDVSFGEVDW